MIGSRDTSASLKTSTSLAGGTRTIGIMASDAIWFASHPDHLIRVRRSLPYERPEWTASGHLEWPHMLIRRHESGVGMVHLPCRLLGCEELPKEVDQSVLLNWWDHATRRAANAEIMGSGVINVMFGKGR